jgi:hypothetical protein
MSSFKYFPKIIYNNMSCINLLSRVALIQTYRNSYEKFYDYLVMEGERPDIIAYKEYDDSSLDWIIYMSNNMIDPYTSWPMDYGNFINYLEDKYNVSADKLTSIVIPSSIAYYYYQGLSSDTPETIAAYNYTMTPNTYQMLGYPAGWVAKSIYDVENEKNEAKRNIKLLRQPYVNEFRQQFEALINE